MMVRYSYSPPVLTVVASIREVEAHPSQEVNRDN